jgi:hypothetical protein
MKRVLLALVGASLCVACEQRVESPAGGGPDMVIEKDTTVLNPPTQVKKEWNTPIVNPPAAEKKTETNTTVNTPGGTSSSTTTTKEQ